MNRYSVRFYRTNLEIYEYDMLASTPDEAVKQASKKLYYWYDDIDASEITEIRVKLIKD